MRPGVEAPTRSVRSPDSARPGSPAESRLFRSLLRKYKGLGLLAHGLLSTLHQVTQSREKQMKSQQSGFTLVEIAIVLVIIGLLLGGILKGQELINSAKVKNLANDFRVIPTYIYSY